MAGKGSSTVHHEVVSLVMIQIFKIRTNTQPVSVYCTYYITCEMKLAYSRQYRFDHSLYMSYKADHNICMAEKGSSASWGGVVTVSLLMIQILKIRTNTQPVSAYCKHTITCEMKCVYLPVHLCVFYCHLHNNWWSSNCCQRIFVPVYYSKTVKMGVTEPQLLCKQK